MRPLSLLSASLVTLAVILSFLAVTQAHAELYKCPQPDGRLTYQQTACGGHADVESFAVDIRGPDGTDTGSTDRDYSISGQAAQMRAEREQLDRARMQARRAAETRHAAAHSSDSRDSAKCAKHRGEAAKWKQKLMNGYRKRTEKDYNENKLAHHQALIDRYCD